MSSQVSSPIVAAQPPLLSVGDIQVDRSTHFATFTVTLNQAVAQPFSVDYDTINGSAYAGVRGDYMAKAGTLHFAAGQTTQVVSIPLAAADAQGAEWFGLRLGALHGPGARTVTVGDAVGQALLGGQEAATLSPYLRIADVVTDEGKGYLEFVATLSAPSAGAVSFSYKAYAADNPGQLLAESRVTIPAGATQHVIRLPIADDTGVRDARNIVLETSAVAGARAERSGATGTVLDNDMMANGIVKSLLSVGTVSVDETAGLVTFAVTLDKPVEAPVSVRYATGDGSAVADPLGGDYQAGWGTVHFAAGEQVKYVTVALRDDALAEQAEMFQLHLATNPTGPGAGFVVVSTTPGEAWIGRSDLPAASTPALTAGSVTVGGNEGYAEFTLTLSAAAPERVSAGLVLLDAQTKATVRFVGSVEFEPGTTLQTVRVPVGEGTPFVADKAYELALATPHNLSTAAGATLASFTVTEGDPAISRVPAASVRDVTVDEAHGTATFSVVLDRPATSPLMTFSWHTADGTARAGSDYVAARGVVTFGAGDVVQRVTVPLVQDHAAEGTTETFQLVIELPDGSVDAWIHDNAGTAYIRDSGGTAQSYTIAARAAVASENGWAEFDVTGSAMKGGPELTYTISGIDADRVAGGLEGTVTLGADGKALLRVHLLDDLSANPDATLKVTLGSGASAAVTVVDTLPLSGTPGNDRFTLPLHRDDRFDGGTGFDTVLVGGVREQFDLASFEGGWHLRNAATGTTITLVDVERIEFQNGAVALDLDGHAGRAYRLYQAAFDRLPDQEGLGFWIAGLDNGATLQDVAAQFVGSAEFAQHYGANLGDAAFVTALYANVLHRAPDFNGEAFWLGALQKGASRASVLVEFSESAEHRASLVASAQDGIEFQVFD
ncbi:Calx-beta domain-containing protein [Pseudoduganella albidiflava]|uniref:DUF4214 domain-containing protein n=1 Tax=Pseudoduganella albidiflava TaxID=321983 RepID=A0A411WT27_9BURK|nr:Calx-beta domain-containing protein [Pseudoduganella albidiflava]QBH99758.1 DUF4214 domain-containing protein [Pseudoduganella albidiflava]GGY62878.1 hypothetical protein GCM10007387_51660 [Pseudoduganella albidiflava]